jgi:predicted dehydrogenase
VYVEKPCSHNIFEGRKCVEAARKYQRIVQHGTQSRSSKGEAKTVAAVQSGKYGKLLVAKAYCCKPRWSIGFKEIENPPPELDFDIWLGPSPKQPYHKNLVHYNWHWFWNTGNGDMGNQGVHQMDIARWGLGLAAPKSVVSLGGRWVNTPDYKDQGVTPNMELNVFDFDGALMVCETRGLVARTDKNGKVSPPVPNPLPTKVANEFYVEGGMITAGNFYPLRGGAPVPIENAALKGNPAEHPEPHFQNFLDCVRSRKSEDLHAEILQGHLSAALCHLGNISYRLGKPAAISRQPEGFPENEQVAASLAAIEKNLTQSLNLDLSKTVYQVGPKLNFDWKAEKFIGSPEADALLTRPARKPYAVPEEV